jgi:hypothetical protein
MAMQLNVVNPSTAAAPATAGKKKAPVNYWLNPGYFVEIGGKRTFVGLPWGLACDNMPEVEIEGSNPEYVALCNEKNKLRNLLMGAFEALEPGEDDIVTDLVFQIRRRKADVAVVEPNEVVGSLCKLSFASKG